jgi:hypothetical protein
MQFPKNMKYIEWYRPYALFRLLDKHRVLIRWASIEDYELMKKNKRTGIKQ